MTLVSVVERPYALCAPSYSVGRLFKVRPRDCCRLYFGLTSFHLLCRSRARGFAAGAA